MATETLMVLTLAQDGSDGFSHFLALFSLVASAGLFLYAFKLGMMYWYE